MMDATDTTSTRPYLIRALYEWCTDNGLTPYLAVAVNDRVQVPREYVKDGEIVLNISFDATSALKLGDDFIEFKGRFAGTARDIMVPVGQVTAIYARENGQGMAFPQEAPRTDKTSAPSSSHLTAVKNGAQSEPSIKLVPLTVLASKGHNADAGDEEPDPPRNATTSPRPALKRVK